jgi:GNAT superfamily N-acetyltransferase
MWKRHQANMADVDSFFNRPPLADFQHDMSVYLEDALRTGSPQFHIAFVEDKPMGFISFRVSVASYVDTRLRKIGLIEELFVDPKFELNGVGVALLSTAEAFFREQKVLVASGATSTQNKKLRSFASHNGYLERSVLLFKELDAVPGSKL